MTDRDMRPHMPDPAKESPVEQTENEDLRRELTRARRQLAMALERSDTLIEKVIEAETARKKLMARISCDIRTPLNAILGCSEILAAEEMTAEQRKHVKLIQSSAKQLLGLVVDAIARCLGVEAPESATTCADGPMAMTGLKRVDENVLSPCLSDATTPGTAAGDAHDRVDKNSAEKSDIQFLGHVLVADDNQIDRMIAQKLLEMLGAKVRTVKNGAEVVEVTRRESYDLVLMDMEMPCMNGYEATRELRDLGMKLPIVALTGHAMKEDQAKCIAAGCDGYLAKPIDQDRLRQVLDRYLKRQVSAVPTPDASTLYVAESPIDNDESQLEELHR